MLIQVQNISSFNKYNNQDCLFFLKKNHNYHLTNLNKISVEIISTLLTKDLYVWVTDLKMTKNDIIKQVFKLNLRHRE